MYMKNISGFIVKPREREKDTEWEGGNEKQGNKTACSILSFI